MGKPAEKFCFKVVVDGVEEIKEQVEKLSYHLACAEDILESLSGVHEISARIVESGADDDGSSA